jgi:hypothetical protein
MSTCFDAQKMYGYNVRHDKEYGCCILGQTHHENKTQLPHAHQKCNAHSFLRDVGAHTTTVRGLG